MEAITPYLNFNGNVGEALAFYEKALEGRVVHKQTFGEAQGEYPTPDIHKDKIMHALFQSGALCFMVSDCPPGVSVHNGDAVSLSLNFTEEAAIEKTFTAMSQEAKITMPLQDTFWGARFGMLQDKFGIHWMFNYDKPQQ